MKLAGSSLDMKIPMVMASISIPIFNFGKDVKNKERTTGTRNQHSGTQQKSFIDGYRSTAIQIRL